jgi:DNA invertase Pin-like site-specific DNA recombinase
VPTAFSYVRFSSDQQKHGASLDRQRDMVAAWLKANPEHALSDLRFEDLGVSGFKGDHLENAFGRLLAAVKSEEIKPGDCILIEAIDRAGRLPPNTMLNILTSITSASVRLVSLDDGLIYDDNPLNANNLFLLVAKCQQAWQYSDALSRRVKDAYQRKRAKAAAGEGAKRRTPLWLDDDGQLIPDLAPLITQCFEDYAAGIGERRIMARIRGKHPALENLNASTVKKWLRNPTALGRWGEIENVYPPVVTPDLWFRVQKRLESQYKPKSASAQYFLSGLVKCGRCGSNFGVLNVGRSPPAMTCMSRHRLGAAGCTNKRSIPYEVLDHIRAQTSHSALQRAAQSQNLTQSEKRVIEVDGELRELHRKSADLVEALAEFGNLPAIREKLAAVSQQIATLENEQTLLKASPAPLSLDDVIEAENDYLDDDPQRLNALLQGVGYVIHCDDKMITVDEPSFGSDSTTQVYRYSHVNRPTNNYVFFQGDDEIRIPVPNALHLAEQARQLAELEKDN